jgi:hypothetical protein
MSHSANRLTFLRMAQQRVEMNLNLTAHGMDVIENTITRHVLVVTFNPIMSTQSTSATYASKSLRKRHT